MSKITDVTMSGKFIVFQEYHNFQEDQIKAGIASENRDASKIIEKIARVATRLTRQRFVRRSSRPLCARRKVGLYGSILKVNGQQLNFLE